VVLEELPLTPNGKVDRRALPSPEVGSGEIAAAPRDEVEAELFAIWRELLGIDGFGVSDDFFALGGHSLLAVRLLGRIESRFGRSLPLSILFGRRTIRELAAVLGADADLFAEAESPLVLLRQGVTGAPPLFLVHPVGGGVHCYLELVRRVEIDGAIYGLQDVLAGEGRRTLEEKAEIYVEQVRSVQPRGPYRLAGWSMGGVLAFEMARRLRDEGEPVHRLILIDSVLFMDGRGTEQLEGPEIVRWFARDLLSSLGRSPSVGLSEDASSYDDERGALRALFERGLEEGVLPRDLEFERLSNLYRRFRENLRAAESYRPSPLHIDALVLRTEVPGPGERGRAADGWQDVVLGDLQVHSVGGSHYSVVREPHVSDLARLLQGELESPE
jgi:thioesterase domain-containing protein